MSRHSHRICGKGGSARVLGRGWASEEDIAHTTCCRRVAVDSTLGDSVRKRMKGARGNHYQDCGICASTGCYTQKYICLSPSHKKHSETHGIVQNNRREDKGKHDAALHRLQFPSSTHIFKKEHRKAVWKSYRGGGHSFRVHSFRVYAPLPLAPLPLHCSCSPV